MMDKRAQYSNIYINIMKCWLVDGMFHILNWIFPPLSDRGAIHQIQTVEQLIKSNI